MASGALSIAQHAPSVEGRIKSLLNADLKTICRANNLGLTGTKVVLQGRCLGLLREIVASQDLVRFEELYLRVNNHGDLPSRPDKTSLLPVNRPSAPGYASYPTSHDRGARLSFHKIPFYEKLQTIVAPHDLPAMPQNRHTVKCDVVLTEDQASRVSANPAEYRVMLYCAQTDSVYSPSLNIAFPSQIEVKVNDDDVKSNWKGLKNKPGSTKPADLTKLVRPRANYSNKLSVCYALTHRKYIFTVLLIRYIRPDLLVARIKAGSVFSKQKVLEDMRRLNADPDIAATSSKMSLKDPISTLRITTPVRSAFCSHSQCFDASFYMQLQEQAPTWTCPICSRSISFESLCVDKYVEEILSTTSASIEQVTVEPDGQWRVVKEDEEKGMSNIAKGGVRASYDDDFDDDLVEIDGPQNAAVKRESIVPGNALGTPPSSSREPSVPQSHQRASGTKRTQAVIDLTLDDDEDEPPRPAKRVQTTNDSSRPLWLMPERPSSVRPSSAQPISLDGTSRPDQFSAGGSFSSRPTNLSAASSPFSPDPSVTSFSKTSDLVSRLPNVSTSTSTPQWGGLHMPQHSDAHRTSMSHSPPLWNANSNAPQQWPRDDGGATIWRRGSTSQSADTPGPNGLSFWQS